MNVDRHSGSSVMQMLNILPVVVGCDNRISTVSTYLPLSGGFDARGHWALPPMSAKVNVWTVGVLLDRARLANPRKSNRCPFIDPAFGVRG
jgi:hypothetical protein